MQQRQQLAGCIKQQYHHQHQQISYTQGIPEIHVY
jgi:hypothetical protein